MKHPFTIEQISNIENLAIEMRQKLLDLNRTEGGQGIHFTTDERNRFGTLHVNLVCLARELERRFGFQGEVT